MRFDWLRRLHEKVLGYVCVDRRVERAEGFVFVMIYSQWQVLALLQVFVVFINEI